MKPQQKTIQKISTQKFFGLDSLEIEKKTEDVFKFRNCLPFCISNEILHLIVDCLSCYHKNGCQIKRLMMERRWQCNLNDNEPYYRSEEKGLHTQFDDVKIDIDFRTEDRSRSKKYGQFRPLPIAFGLGKHYLDKKEIFNDYDKRNSFCFINLLFKNIYRQNI